MKKLNLNKNKLFIIITLVVLVVGMTLFGVFGFNQSVDYNGSYELKVSVDQKSGNATEILCEKTSEFISKNSLKPSGAVQKLDEGKIIIYKFNTDVTDAVAGIDDYVSTALTAEGLTTVGVEVSVGETAPRTSSNAWWVVLAIGIAVVVAFVYVAIMDKLAAAVSTIFSAVLSALLFVALMGITRVPALPFVAIGLAVSVAVSMALSVSTLRRYKEEGKNSANEKLSAKELTEKLFAVETRKHLVALCAIALGAIALVVMGLTTVMFAGVQLLLAGIVGVYTATFSTPFIWSAIKDKNKN